MNKKILFIYNWVEPILKKDKFIECASTLTIENISKALVQSGYEIIHLNLLNQEQLKTAVKVYNPFFAYVIAEGFLDYPETLFDGLGSSMVRELLEEMNVPYTHSSPEGMTYCRNKDITSKILRENNISVPNFFVLPEATQLNNYINFLEELIAYPVFVKPTGGGSSIGIDETSIVKNRDELINKVDYLKISLNNPSVIIEKYLPGREYTIGVIGNTRNIVLPIIAFPNNYLVRSYNIKKAEADNKSNLEIIYFDNTIYQQLYPIAIETFSALKARDLVRIDIKRDINGNPMVIDVNGTPSLASGGSLVFMSEQIGITYPELINLILGEALQRYKIPMTTELLKLIDEVSHKIKNYCEYCVA